MLKTHRKSLLSLAIIPALFAAQLSGLTGVVSNVGVAHAALAFSVTATSSVAAGGTLTVTVSGASAGEYITITVNSPRGTATANHYSNIDALHNGDTTEYGAGYEGYPIAGYANILQQTVVANSSGTLSDSNFTIPGDAVPGTYGVSAAGVADSSGTPNTGNDYGSTTFTVTSSNNSLAINGSTGTQSVSLGQEFSAFYNSFTAGSAVNFYLENFDFNDSSSSIPTTAPGTAGVGTVSGLVQSTGSTNGTGAAPAQATVGEIPLQVVSCGSNASIISGDAGCQLTASSTALNATLALATPSGTPLLSSLFYDQVYSVVASQTTASSSTGAGITSVADHTFSLAEPPAGDLYTITTSGVVSGTPTSNAITAGGATDLTALKTAIDLTVPTADANDVSVAGTAGGVGTDGTGITVTFSGALAGNTLISSAYGTATGAPALVTALSTTGYLLTEPVAGDHYLLTLGTTTSPADLVAGNGDTASAIQADIAALAPAGDSGDVYVNEQGATTPPKFQVALTGPLAGLAFSSSAGTTGAVLDVAATVAPSAARITTIAEPTAGDTYTLATAGGSTPASVANPIPSLTAGSTSAATLLSGLQGTITAANAVDVSVLSSVSPWTVLFFGPEGGDTLSSAAGPGGGVAASTGPLAPLFTTWTLSTGSATTGSFHLSINGVTATDTGTVGSTLATTVGTLLDGGPAPFTLTSGAPVGTTHYYLEGAAAGPLTITLPSGDSLSSTDLSSLSTSAAAGGVTAENGIKLDHTLSSLSVSNTLVAVGSSVSVSGYNFGAGSTVAFYFVDQLGGGGTGYTDCLSPGTSTPGAVLVGSSITSADSSYQGSVTGCYLGSTTASGGPSTVSTPGGSFSGVSLTLPSSTSNNSYSGGKILAVDLGPSGNTGAGHRLNESAYAAVLVSSLATSPGQFALSTTTPAVDETVTFTATGFLASTSTAPYYATLTGATICSLSSYPLGQDLVDTTGTVHGSFTVPTGCSIAGGDSYTLTLAGTATNGSSQSLTSTISIPSTAIVANTNGTTITFTGTGFEAGETVSLQLFSTVSTGTAGTPLAVVTAGSDGTITGTAAAPSGLSTGYYYVEASGTSSGFTATANVGYSVGGIINTLPTLVPGETVTVSGTQFLAPPSGGAANTLSINFLPTAVNNVPMTVDASGNMSATFTVPTGTITGTYTLTAEAYVPGAALQQQRFQTINVATGLVASLTASPTSVAIGGTTTIAGSGFAPNETVTVALDYANDGLAGTAVPGTQETFTASPTGAISGVYTVKSSAGALVPGTYSLVATGASTLSATLANFVVASAGTTVSTANIYFAEGYTGQTSAGAAANFAETISILNANNYTTTYTVTYFVEHTGAASTVSTVAGSIGADSVVEESVNKDAGNGVSVAAEVSSPAPLAATRIIARTTSSGSALDSSSSLGQELNLAATGPFSYYFATGDVLPTNEQYLTILNPNSTAATITVNILPQTVVSSTTTPTVAPLTLNVPANSRLTEPIRAALQGKGFTQFGVSLSSNVPVAAERVEYYGDGSGSGKYGASTKPASSSTGLQYIFAADTGTWPSTGGTAGTGADVSEVDIINPAPATTSGSATVTVSFLDASGNPINSQQVQVDPSTRETVAVNDVVLTQGGVFSTIVTSDRPIYVERPTAFGGDPSKGGTFAEENPAGAPAGLTEVAFPYLDLLNGTTAVSQTVYLYNPGTTTITVRGIYASATKTVVTSYSVKANSITAVSVNADASTLTGAIGGVFQVVPSYSGSSESFVALSLSSQNGFKVVTGDQGTYPITASLGL